MPLEDTETGSSRGFIAAFEEDLIAYANAEKRFVASYPFAYGGDESLRLKGFGAITKGTNTR